MFYMKQEECNVSVHNQLGLHTWSLRLPSLKDGAFYCHSAQRCTSKLLYTIHKSPQGWLKRHSLFKEKGECSGWEGKGDLVSNSMLMSSKLVNHFGVSQTNLRIQKTAVYFLQQSVSVILKSHIKNRTYLVCVHVCSCACMLRMLMSNSGPPSDRHILYH